MHRQHSRFLHMDTKEKNEEKKCNTIYLNRLRIVGAFFVIIIHFIGSLFDNYETSFLDWSIFSIINIVVRTAVPIYVMISGALFLKEDKKISFKKLLLHNVLRLVIIYFLWTFVYNIKDYSWDGIKAAFLSFDSHYYHMWYLPMLICLYLLVPALRCLCKKENKKIVEYILILFVIFNCVLGFFQQINISPAVNYIFDCFSFFTEYIPINYVGIFIAGWYFSTFSQSKSCKIVIYVLGAVACLVSPLTWFNGNYTLIGKFQFISDNIGILNFSITIAIFQFAKCSRIFNFKSKFFDFISNCTMGCYLIHFVFLNFFYSIGFGELILSTTTLIPRLLTFFLLGIAVFICSIAFSTVINLVPKKIRRWFF